jgi:ribonuclease HI
LCWQLRLSNQEFENWRQKQAKTILFFDGASEGNSGTTSMEGGVIFDPGGNQNIRYSWGLGNKTNNQVEVLVVYMGLTLIP